MMILQLCDGKIDDPALPTINFILRFTYHEQILNWLVKNRKNGKWVSDKIKYEHNNSQLDFVKWVIAQVNKEKFLRPIIVGKDFR